MSTDKLKNAIQKTQKGNTIAHYIAQRQTQIRSALPKHLSVERLSRIAMTAVSKNPQLGQADVGSLFGAIMECAAYGLEPGIRAHLVPFFSKEKNAYIVNYIPDYRGLIDLARRSGEIGPFYAFEVRKNDLFEYSLGLDMDLVHKPAEGDRGEITHFYAVAKAKDGSWAQFDVMTKADVDAIRGRSRAGKSGPWVTDYESMGKKTVIRRLCKLLPSSIELQAAVQADEAAEVGEQDTTAWLEAEYVVEEKVEGKAEEEVPEATRHLESKDEEPVENPFPVTVPSLLRRIDAAQTAEQLDEIRSLSNENLKGTEKMVITKAAGKRFEELQSEL